VTPARSPTCPLASTELLRLLARRSRLELLAAVAEEPASASALAARLELTPEYVRRELARLRRAGLVLRSGGSDRSYLAGAVETVQIDGSLTLRFATTDGIDVTVTLRDEGE
jgi:DNA-binding transcriptional ArsR family regulator